MIFIKSIGIVWALFTSLNMNAVADFHYHRERYNVTIPLGGTAFISCICGEKEVKRNIPEDRVDFLFEGAKNHTFCEGDSEIASCNLFKKCKNCTAEVRKCTPTLPDLPYKAIHFDCILKRMEGADLFPPKKEEKIFVWAFASLNMNPVATLNYHQEHYNVTIPLEGAAFISCICEEEEVKRDILADSVDFLLEGALNHTFCEGDSDIASCNLIENCKNCTAEVRKCTPTWSDLPYEAIQFDCILKRMEKAHLFPPKKEEKIGFIEYYLRLIGKASTCLHPKSLKTADVICGNSAYLISCEQKCFFGYTLKEGITRKLYCVHSENVWKPTGFEECRRIDLVTTPENKDIPPKNKMNNV